jgi:putative GTP pyrophosphokinase
MDTRQGQTTRFELMLLAALGERFVERHAFRGSPWFEERQKRYLKIFRERGIQTSVYDPVAAIDASNTD